MHQHESTTQHIGLVAPIGTQHGFVELWCERERGHIQLIGYFANVFTALGVVGTDVAGYYLTSAGGRTYERLETGAN